MSPQDFPDVSTNAAFLNSLFTGKCVASRGSSDYQKFNSASMGHLTVEERM